MLEWLLLIYIGLGIVVFTALGTSIWYRRPEYWVGPLSFLVGTMTIMLMYACSLRSLRRARKCSRRNSNTAVVGR